MSDWDEKTRAPEVQHGHLARRPLGSFIRGVGYEFTVLEWDAGRGKGSDRCPVLIAYRETDERTFWQRVKGVDGNLFEIIPERTEKARRGA